MKKKILLFLIPILVIFIGLLFINKDTKSILSKANIFKDDPPVNIIEIDLSINEDISSEFTNSVQVRQINQVIQSYLTYDRNSYNVYAQLADSTGNPLRPLAYLDTGVDYYFVFDISPKEGYVFIDNIPVKINDSNVSEEKITRHDGTITVLVDAPDVDLKDFGIEITPAPTFNNLIEGYNNVAAGTFTITNTGSGSLDNISIVLSDSSAFELDNTNLPTSLDSLQSGIVTITPKLGLNPGVHNSIVTITADRLPNPVIKEIEVKVLNRIDYLDITLDDLSQYLIDTNTEGQVSDLVFDATSTTSSNPGYEVTRTNTKLTYLNGSNYAEINPTAFIELTKNYFYNIVVEADNDHGFAENVIVRVNNNAIPNFVINNNRDESNFDRSSNKKVQLHIKASIPTHVDEGVVIPTLRSSSITYNGQSQAPEILFADSNLVTCTSTSEIYVGEYEVLCELNDPDNYNWVDTSNSSKTLEWSIVPIQTTLLPRPSNEVKLPKGNNVDLNTVVTKNTTNPLICSSNMVQPGITREGCVVKSTFESIEGTTSQFTINVDGIDINQDGVLEYTNAEPYPIRVTTISNKPTNLEWEDKTAKWDKINGIGSYQVSLYDGSNNQQVVQEEVNTNQDDFSDVIEDGKSYYFTVASNTDSGLGEVSDSSPVFDTRQEHVLTHELVDQTVIYGNSFSYPISFTDNEGTRTYSSSNPQVASIDNNGNITIKNVGQTQISLTAGAINSYRETTKSYTLTVIPRRITKPIYNKETSFSYNGKVIYLDYPTNYNETYMTISGTYGINPGNYKMVVSLKDNTNYTWSDGSINDITYNWEIYRINNAVYRMTSALNTSRVIDIKGGSKDNKANVQLYTSSNSTAQRFYIKYIKDGYYTIENLRSMKVFDVKGGKAANGTNVWQYTYNGSNAQLWKATKNSDNTYTFTSKLGNYVINIAGGKTANGTNVEIYRPNGAKSTRFYLERDNFLTGSQTVPNGTYVIGISKAKNQVLDIASGSTANKANVQLYKSNNSKAQQFKITYVKDGYYKIINVKSNKSLDVKSASQKNGANIWQYTYNESAAQLWKIHKYSNGTYTFISRCNGKVIDAKGGKTANKTNIQMYSSNGSAAQKYYLIKK